MLYPYNVIMIYKFDNNHKLMIIIIIIIISNINNYNIKNENCDVHHKIGWNLDHFANTLKTSENVL